MNSGRAVALPLELRTILAGLATAEVTDNQQWILALMRSHGIAAVSLLWRMLGSEADVLDAYQTVICQLTARGREHIGSNPGGYFYRTAVNAGIELLRRRKMTRRQLPAIAEARAVRDDLKREETDGARTFDNKQMLESMRHAILELPPYLRDVIVLHDLAELPYGNVADILGITEGTARVYRRQAVVRLADLMGQENDR